ncbi:MAG: hypothetical protein JWP00_3465, partial [Chloroflexi bacterium]|nr:hypothetical protein [Chloroflexota bacterium]
IARAIQATNSAIQHIGSVLSQSASLVGNIASYQRRKEEWDFQGRLATIEIAQIGKQIAAAEVRLAIAEKELENQDLQIDQTQAVDDYIHNKYTNQQLYDWHIKQLGSIYFQSYQLAFDMAKEAEKSYQFELGDAAASFIEFGYWDSLKKGLLSGERLANDLHRMEKAYLDNDKRLLEITKNVSLAQFQPLSLMQLKESGTCTVTLAEWLYNLDFPSHYRRRIRLPVSVTIPGVVGPYTSVNCTLTLLKHGIRLTDDLTGGYGDPLAGADTRFDNGPVPVTSIVTSHGQNDPGLFDPVINDDRYFPFEGAGAVSEWRLDLPRENNQFDPATISDVILQIRYTAMATGNAAYIQAAKDALAKTLPTSGQRLLVLNQDFSVEWYNFLFPKGGADQILTLKLGQEHLPFNVRGKPNISVTALDLIVEGLDGVNYNVQITAPGAQAASAGDAKPEDVFGKRHHLGLSGLNLNATGDWKIQLKKDSDNDFKSLKPEDIKNTYLVMTFKTS